MRPLLMVLGALSALITADRFPNNFSPYPTAAQSCLNTADRDSGCDGSSMPTMNRCLCTITSNFITSAAQCISRESPDDLEATYAILQTNCDRSNTPIEITKAEFLQLGDGVTTTRQPKETNLKDDESKEESEEQDNSAALATGAKIIIAVSAVVVVGLILVGIVMIRRHTAKDRSKQQETPAERMTSQQPQIAELE